MGELWMFCAARRASSSRKEILSSEEALQAAFSLCEKASKLAFSIPCYIDRARPLVLSNPAEFDQLLVNRCPYSSCQVVLPLCPIEASARKDSSGLTKLICIYTPPPQEALAEPPRDSRRLQFLRGWSHENSTEIFTGVSRTGRPAGV